MKKQKQNIRTRGESKWTNGGSSKWPSKGHGASMSLKERLGHLREGAASVFDLSGERFYDIPEYKGSIKKSWENTGKYLNRAISSYSSKGSKENEFNFDESDLTIEY